MNNILAVINWNVDPVIFEVFGRPIVWYGLFFASSFMVGFYLMRKMFEAEKIAEKVLDQLLIYVLIGTVIGARLGHVLFYEREYYFNNPEDIIKIWEGGLASHGAAIGILLSLWAFTVKVSKKPFLWIADKVVITIASAAVFIRFGNLMNSEIIGQPTDAPWAFIFERVDMLPRHPTQLYESLSYLVLFGFMYYLYWKTNAKNYSGRIFGVFLAGLFGIRFLLEFTKVHQADFATEWPLNMGQLLSIPAVLAGLLFIYLSYKKEAIPLTEEKDIEA